MFTIGITGTSALISTISNIWFEGFGESDLRNVKIGEIIQFERNFFVKLEKKDNKYKFIFCHK